MSGHPGASFAYMPIKEAYRNYSNRMVDPIYRKIEFFVNPIIPKVAPLIIFERIQFSKRTPSSRIHKALLANQNGKIMAKVGLLSLSGMVLIKTTLMKHR